MTVCVKAIVILFPKYSLFIFHVLFFFKVLVIRKGRLSMNNFITLRNIVFAFCAVKIVRGFLVFSLQYN